MMNTVAINGVYVQVRITSQSRKVGNTKIYT